MPSAASVAVGELDDGLERRYRVWVEGETGPGGALETGVGIVHVLARTRPSLGLTSIFTPGRPSPIHQTTRRGQDAPFPYELLLWDREGRPLVGVTISKGSGNRYLLVRGASVVGEVTVATSV